MAEAVVSTALETLRDLLLEEVRFLAGVKDQVRELEIQLTDMKCFLEDADKRRHENKTIFNLISKIKDLVYRAEVAIERHDAYHVLSRRRRGLTQLIRRYSCTILEDWYSLHQLGSEISWIKSQLEKINKEMLENGIKKSIINNADEGESSSANNWARMTLPYFKMDDCFVGMKEELKQLVHLLEEDKRHRVITVWGMGGSGKTTIARKLYNDIKYTKNGSFESFAWVCISQQCQIRSVLEDILRQLRCEENNVSTNLSDAELINQLHNIQREKRCLIVLDDLWKISHWDQLNHPFLIHDLQSKILITTREEEVAKIGCLVKVGLLNEEDALELLKKKTFPDKNIPDFALEENFEKIGKQMVKKCGYLPLAICLLSGVLRMKNSMREWELVVNEDIKDSIYKNEKIDGVLNLSYESLPYYLKPCFLYMGIFQEDEDIYVKDIYTGWIAQGMISYENVPYKDKKKTLMDIAELYLGELRSRSIIQVEIYDGVTPGGLYWRCKIHDVVRELCLKLGKREDFGLQSLEYQSGKLSTLLQQASSDMKIRHLAIHFRTGEVEPDELGEDTSKHLRSLRMFNRSRNSIELPQQSIVDFQRFKLLRDLVMVGFKFVGRKLPKGITNLVHLRCLRLQDCEFDMLPLSIRNLVYMDTLDLKYSSNVGVPDVFKEMVRLKHLFLPDYDEAKIGSYRLTLDEGVVDQLESLWGLDSRVHELKCMKRMENLESFATKIHDIKSLLAMIDAIAIMNKLVFCVVFIMGGCELETNEGVLTLKKAFTCPNLHELWIHVKIGKVLAECCGHDFSSSKLKNLYLYEGEIEDDPMGILGNLPWLSDLRMCFKSFVGEEMMCPSNSFPHLKRLWLHQLPKLREWRVEAGAMPLLSHLHISYCDSLEMLPDGLSGISTLQELIIVGALGKRVLPSGEDFHKVSHVPSIIIRNYQYVPILVELSSDFLESVLSS